MDPIGVALTGVLAPAVLAGVILVVAAFVGRRAGGSLKDLAAPRWAGVALAAGFGLGFALTLGWPALLPVDVTQVGPWAAVFAAPLGFASAPWRAGGTAVLGLGLGLFLAGPTQSGGELALSALVIAVTVVAIERGLGLASAGGRIGVLLALGFVSAVAAVVLLSDTASLAVTTGGLAAALGAVFVASLVAPGLATIERAAPVIALVSATHLHAATLYAGGSLGPVLLLSAAPLTFVLIASLVRSRGGVAAIAVPGVALVLTLGAAGAWAATRYFGDEPSEAPSGGEESTPEDYGY